MQHVPTDTAAAAANKIYSYLSHKHNALGLCTLAPLAKMASTTSETNGGYSYWLQSAHPWQADLVIECDNGRTRLPVSRSAFRQDLKGFERLAENDANGGSRPIIHCPDVDERTLRLTLDVLYSYQCDLDAYSAMQVVPIAKRLHLSAVVRMCANKLVEHLKDDNVLAFLVFADSHDCEEMRVHALRHLRRYASSLADRKIPDGVEAALRDRKRSTLERVSVAVCPHFDDSVEATTTTKERMDAEIGKKHIDEWNSDNVIAFLGTTIRGFSDSGVRSVFADNLIDGIALKLLTTQLMQQSLDVPLGVAVKIRSAVDQVMKNKGFVLKSD